MLECASLGLSAKFSTPVEKLVEKTKDLDGIEHPKSGVSAEIGRECPIYRLHRSSLPMSATTIWDQVLTLIEGKVGPHSFSTWFKPTSLEGRPGPGTRHSGAGAALRRVAAPTLLGRPGRGAGGGWPGTGPARLRGRGCSPAYTACGTGRFLRRDAASDEVTAPVEIDVAAASGDSPPAP